MNSDTGKKLLLIVLLLGWAALALTGCTSLRRPEELAWQGLHVYDTLQTMNMADEPCYKENSPVTRAVLGADPSKGRVVAWGVGASLVHAGVSDWLITHEHPGAYRVWQTLTFVDTAIAVHGNYSIGVRVGAPNTRTAAGGCK
jgi:hypothetical protein